METLDRMTPERFREIYRPARPYAGDTKEQAIRMSKEQALEKLFIQNHAKKARNLIVIDIDKGYDSIWDTKGVIFDDEALPEYTYLTTNSQTGNSQAVWAIQESVGTDRGIDFLEFIQKSFTKTLGGDPGYQNLKSRNPLHSNQITEWGEGKLYSMGDLHKFTQPLPERYYTKKNKLPEVGRHNILFNKLSAVSYTLWRQPDFDTRIMLEAHRINNEFEEKLPFKDLQSTAYSIQRFIAANFTEEKFREIQRRRNQKSIASRKRTALQKAEEIVAMLDTGFTTQEIQETMGIKTIEATWKAIQRAKKLVQE